MQIEWHLAIAIMNIKRYVHNRIWKNERKSKERKFREPNLARKRMCGDQFIRRSEYKQTLIGNLEKEAKASYFCFYFPLLSFDSICLLFVNIYFQYLCNWCTKALIAIIAKMFRRTKCKLADIDNCGYELQTINNHLFLFKVQLTVLHFIRFAVFFCS